MDAATPVELLNVDCVDREQDLSIAAIIPLYNGARWIEQAVRSVLAQTRMPDELIIVDDGSTDDGPVIVEELAAQHPSIALLRKSNGGQSAARNFAVAHCKSALIALLDQDDIWYPNHLEDLVEPLRAHKGLPLGWVYSDFDDIDEDGAMIARSFVDGRLENPKRHLYSMLSGGCIIQPSATLISRSAFEAVGGFDERLCGYEDDDLFLRIFRANFDNIYVPSSTSQWRVHETSCGASDRHDASLKIYVQKLIGLFPDDKWRGAYYARDLLAPRFIRTWVAMYARAARYDNDRKMREYAREALGLVHHLRIGPRVMFGIALTMMRSPLAGRAILATRPYWNHLYKTWN